MRWPALSQPSITLVTVWCVCCNVWSRAGRVAAPGPSVASRPLGQDALAVQLDGVPERVGDRRGLYFACGAGTVAAAVAASGPELRQQRNSPFLWSYRACIREFPVGGGD